MGRVSSIGGWSGTGSLFPDASLKESVENRKLRMAISDLLAQARQRNDEGLIEYRATFVCEMTTGQAVKLRDCGCRIWMLDTAMNEWYYNDFIDGKLVFIYEEDTSDESSSNL